MQSTTPGPNDYVDVVFFKGLVDPSVSSSSSGKCQAGVIFLIAEVRLLCAGKAILVPAPADVGYQSKASDVSEDFIRSGSSRSAFSPFNLIKSERPLILETGIVNGHEVVLKVPSKVVI